jgi:rubrerythrin
MQGIYPYFYRAEFHPVWMTNRIQTLELISQSVHGELNDELFYGELINLSPSQEQSLIISSIRDDERGHHKMFLSLYKEITGHEVSGIGDEQHQKLDSYDTGLQRALLGELSAVEKYRKIWFGLPPGIYRDTVFGIILDELKHASMYNYLLTLNRTKA